MEFNVGDRVIIRNKSSHTDLPEHGVIKMSKPTTDPNSRRRIIIYGVLTDGKVAPKSLSELEMLVNWLPEEDLILE